MKWSASSADDNNAHSIVCAIVCQASLSPHTVNHANPAILAWIALSITAFIQRSVTSSTRLSHRAQKSTNKMSNRTTCDVKIARRTFTIIYSCRLRLQNSTFNSIKNPKQNSITVLIGVCLRLSEMNKTSKLTTSRSPTTVKTYSSQRLL